MSLIERLRSAADPMDYRILQIPASLCGEAADALEQAQAEIERLSYWKDLENDIMDREDKILERENLQARVERLEAALCEVRWRIRFAVERETGGKYSQEALEEIIDDTLAAEDDDG